MQDAAMQAAVETRDTVVVPTRIEIQDVNDAVALISGKLERWIESAVATLPNLLVATLVFLVFWGVSRAVRGVLERGLRRAHLSGALRNLLTTIAGVAVLAFGLFVALGILGLDKTVTSLLAGVGILGLALGFAFQDLAANFMAGTLLSIRRPFEVGHLIETNDFMGTVVAINLRDTKVRTFTGQLVRIPNKEVFNNSIINYTEPSERRVDLDIGVSYGDDLPLVQRVTREAIERNLEYDRSRPVEVFFTGFGDSSIDLQVRFWMPHTRQPEFLQARSEAIKAVKAAYDAADITIPFPIRTLDFGIKGGATLADVAPRVALGSG